MKIFNKSTKNNNIFWLEKLKLGISNSSKKLKNSINNILFKNSYNKNFLQNLEDILLQSDLGFVATTNIIEKIKKEKIKNNHFSQVNYIVREELINILKISEKSFVVHDYYKPHIFLIVGINGTGKTTTIGKLATKLSQEGFSTMLVAGDKFRAAAHEQLLFWGKEINVPVFASDIYSDTASLSYAAIEYAKKKDIDVIFIDTAGRLHNKLNLMSELQKIIRVIKKIDQKAPHDIIQIIDATNGQNTLNQVESFKKFANINGLIITKIDGTSKGGIIVPISYKYQLPIYFLGVGENKEDLIPFSAKNFASAII